MQPNPSSIPRVQGRYTAQVNGHTVEKHRSLVDTSSHVGNCLVYKQSHVIASTNQKSMENYTTRFVTPYKIVECEYFSQIKTMKAEC